MAVGYLSNHSYLCGVDRLSPSARSANMARVRGKNTRPELLVRKQLHRLGYRFRLHRKSLPGKPDIVLPRHRLALFIHGCFWHRHEGCRRATLPQTRPEFWRAKFQATVQRDIRQRAALEASGWRVAVIWECETRNVEKLYKRLASVLPEASGSNGLSAHASVTSSADAYSAQASISSRLRSKKSVRR